ncbi:MAG: NAD(P)/FAD-dependent oxidoreductase [Pseudomonadota bacterium]
MSLKINATSERLPRFDADCVVAGAGVVGLAIARALAIAGRDVLIVEAASAIGTGNSSRNSEVIHAGIYYPEGSSKAECCLAGKWALYDYLRSRNIGHRNCGKLIVATTEAELDRLDAIVEQGRSNGVDDLALLNRSEVVEIEPALNVTGAIHSPSTGIVDSHGLMVSLLGEAEDHGTRIAFQTQIVRGKALSDGRTELECAGSESCILTATTFINSAGLAATGVAASIDGFPEDAIPELFLAKGNYFTLSSRVPFDRLIYPVPIHGGLGVHLTLDLGGAARFGPDVEWVEQETYDVAEERGALFYDAIRTYWPDLEDDALHPAYSGIRPNLVGPGKSNTAADFQILGPAQHEVNGQVHLFGIESPGLTGCLEIARRVVKMAA